MGQAIADFYDRYADGSGDEKDYRSALTRLATDGMFVCPISAMARYKFVSAAICCLLGIIKNGTAMSLLPRTYSTFV